MSLLSNLTLAYENLVDDPIEMGIAYGKSILSAVGSSGAEAKFVPKRAVVQMPRRATVARVVSVRRPEHSNYMNFRTRSPQSPMRRQMIGVI